MAWEALPLGGRVVNTRNPVALERGEFQLMSNVRLSPGDTIQVRRDRGSRPVSIDVSEGVALSETIIEVRLASFENQSDVLILVTVGPSDSHIYSVPYTGGTATLLQTISGASVSKVGIVQYGDRYYIGTDVGNYVLTGPTTILAMGMDAPQDYTGGLITVNEELVASNPEDQSSFAQYDLPVYLVTEYDEDNDVESGVFRHAEDYASGQDQNRCVYAGIASLPTIRGLSVAQAHVRISTSAWTKQNARATGLNLYRIVSRDLGSSPTAYDVNRYLTENIGGQGGEPVLPISMRLVKRNIPFSDVSAYLDYARDLPLGGPAQGMDFIFVGDGTSIYEKNRKPDNWTVGETFNDSLVCNAPDVSTQVLKYSPPGEPEVQPVPYFAYFATDRQDDIVGLHNINDRLVVLLTQSVHRMNYLPFEGNLRADAGRVQETISRNQGCVGRRASAKIETPQGQLVVWLGRQGLLWTNGGGWDDACPDWSVEGAGIDTTKLATAVLVNDARDYRLRLYVDGSRYDFYYHSRLMENGRLRCTGPHDEPADFTGDVVMAASGSPDGRVDRVWVSDANTVRWANDGVADADMKLKTGAMRADNPMKAVKGEGFAVDTSTTDQPQTITAKLFHQCNEDVNDQNSVVLVNAANLGEDTYRDSLEGYGNRLVYQLECSGSGDVALGPAWIDGRVVVDGDG